MLPPLLFLYLACTSFLSGDLVLFLSEVVIMAGNRIVHFEIPSKNPLKTVKFFEQAFGWKFKRFGKEEYWLATTGDKKAMGIDGAVMKRMSPNQPVVNTLMVADVDKALAKVKKAGGKVFKPKMPVPSMGWVAYFTDPDGVCHGVFKPDMKAK
jgi:uncharacterized protein